MIRIWLFVVFAFLLLAGAWSSLIMVAVKHSPSQVEVKHSPQR